MAVESLWRRALVTGAMVLLALPAGAGDQAEQRWPFENPEKRKIFHDLLHEFACPSCDGSSLAESPAPVAEDIRQVLYDQVVAGRTKEDIRRWMIDRYGEGIHTGAGEGGGALLLWLFPAVLAVAAGLALYRLFVRPG